MQARATPLRLSATDRRRLAKGLLFISPWIAGFLVFQLYPIVMSVYYSMTDYDGLRPAFFLGLANYAEMLQDSLFWTALSNTLLFVLFAVPGGVIVGFLLASLLNLNLWFRSVLRTIFFVPSVVPEFVSALVWLWIYDKQYGLIDAFLASHDIAGIPWLSSPDWSKPSLIIIAMWACGSTMVIFLAALQDVPRELYEAARIDGAHPHHELRHITLPMVSPAIFFNLLIGLIGAFQYFTLPTIMTQGGPADSTRFYAMYIYQNAFSYFRMGYASAAAWMLFLLVVVCALILFRSSARLVYYGGDLS